MPFSPDQRDEEVLAEVIATYFTPEELAEAQRLSRTSSYEAAIAYLTTTGANSLRDSGEACPPRVYITIPGGHVLVHHPARLFPAPTLYSFSVQHLALQAFPPPASANARQEEEPAQFLFFDGEQAVEHRPAPEKQKARSSTRPRTCTFVEQPIRIGTSKHFWTRKGWRLKNGFLGYVLARMPSGSYRVELVHLVSNWVLTSVYIDAMDETTQDRLQAWAWDAHDLTDWSRGIAAILKEKPGKQKKWAWDRDLQRLWDARRLEPRQVSFF